MRRLRFTIARLLVVVLFVAVGFAALRESNDLWESGLFTLTLTVLPVSIRLAVHRTEGRRASWLGFALFGWGYLGLSLVPSIESRLMTTKALTYLDSKVPGRARASFLSLSHRRVGGNAIVPRGPLRSSSRGECLLTRIRHLGWGLHDRRFTMWFSGNLTWLKIVVGGFPS